MHILVLHIIVQLTCIITTNYTWISPRDIIAFNVFHSSALWLCLRTPRFIANVFTVYRQEADVLFLIFPNMIKVVKSFHVLVEL